ncbi:MAG TPA: hypothetical protein VHS55_00025 [Solirubrobacteraceae bacterium]|jgi:hypothetical protein|nr:hypothetical protein [Solirubrobacteraceae bacterium]
MPTPANTPATTTGGREIQNPQLFDTLTERQAMPQTVAAFAGFAKGQRLIIEKVGVLARIRLLVKVTFTPKEEEKAEVRPGFPWKLIKEIALQANGVTGIIDCNALVLEQRRRRVYRNPVSAILKTPKQATKLKKEAITTEFVVEIPVAHDMLSLIGALLAQNEETTLSVLINWASEAEVFGGADGVEKVEGEVLWGTTVFSIGSTVVGKQEVTVLPDLSAFHGIVQSETQLNATGQRNAELIRTAGQLLCYTATVFNKANGAAVLSPAEWTSFKIEYGGNKDPLNWTPAAQLLEENADDYDGALNVEGVSFLAVDNERDNPSRDMIIPESLTELRAVLGIPAGFKPEEAQILTSQETLYPAV